ncbi:MAG TPA: peptide ABC transporter substrate-binding protein [Chloroflexota bacterium]|nr:peptide ABC transporter substrate-binding protein [Chloroflexota bacterium]
MADDENVQLAGMLYSGLVRLDSSYRVVPDDAQRIVISPDHRTYTFYLRKDLRFSNGDPITAYDFRFSLNRSLTPGVKSPSAPTYLLDIDGARLVLEGKAKSASGIRVLNTLTLQLTTRWPVPYFLMELTYPTSFVLDKAAVLKSGSIDNTGWYANPVSSGPYRLKSWAPNSQMTLVPNKYYYGHKSALRSIDVVLTNLPSSGLYQYVSHNLDVVTLPSYDKSLLKKPGIHDARALSVDGIYMNFKTKAFTNGHLRRALAVALNRSKMVSSVMGATASPFGGSVPSGQPGYDPKLQLPRYDVSSGQRELAAAGSANVKALNGMTLYFADDPSIAKLAQAIVKAWHDTLKITVGTQALALTTLLADVQSSSLPLYLLGWSADYPDPHDFLSLQWKSRAPDNNVHYSNPTFDTIVSKADVTWNPALRVKLDNQAQQELANDTAWIPLYIPHRLVYIRPTVANLDVTGYGLIPRFGSWAQVQIKATPSRAAR